MKLFFTHLLISTALFAQAQFKSNLKDLELRGKVKSLTESEIQIIDGEQNELRRYSCSFDSHGNKTDDKHSDAQGTVLYNSTYKYDAKGRLIETITLDKDAKLAGRQTFSYDNGKVVERTATATKTLRVTGEYEFDKTGKPVKHVEQDGDIVTRTTTLEYDDRKYKTTERIKTSEGEELLFRYTCNDAGQISEKKQLNASGKELFKTTYKYDDKGNASSESSAYTGEPVQTVITYQYKYDDDGNWTERKESMNEVPFLTISRKIQYY